MSEKNKVYCQDCIHLKQLSPLSVKELGNFFFIERKVGKHKQVKLFEHYCTVDGHIVYEKETEKSWLRPRRKVGYFVNDPGIKNANNDCEDFEQNENERLPF